VIAEILAYADKIAAAEITISAVVDGLVADGAADDYVAEEDTDSFDDSEGGNGGGEAMTRRLAELQLAALDRFAAVRAGFGKLRRAFEKHGHGWRPTAGPASAQQAGDGHSLHGQDDRHAVRSAEHAGRTCSQA
jgi:hypothetical protein